VQVGGKVTLSSGPVGCHATYPPGKTYAVTLALVGRAAPKPLGKASVKPDGSFAATIVIPPDAPPGEAYLEIKGSAFDTCNADTHNSSCAVYASPALTIRPAQ
jgi:hypothetical protein